MAKSEEISFTSAHEIKADRRILKTKKAIYEALVELMQKKKLNSITVTELAAQADINRKTFYTYYSTVNDVLDEGINELITSLKDLLCAMSEDYNMFSPQTLFAFLNTIMSDADIARDLFASDNGSLLFNRLQKALQETLLKELESLYVKSSRIQIVLTECMIMTVGTSSEINESCMSIRLLMLLILKDMCHMKAAVMHMMKL